MKLINHNENIFKNQYILESLATVDSGFTYDITHGSDDNVTSIMWMTSHTCNNFE